MGSALTEPTRRVPMAALSAERAIASFDEVNLGYTPEEAQAEAARGADLDYSDSQRACPFGVDVGRMVQATAAGDFNAALAAVMECHPWPGILGRWCAGWCEHSLKTPDGPEPPNLKALERAAGAYGDQSKFRLRPAPPSGKRVAVVGAGSAASAAVYSLRRHGHAVDVYEQLPVSGGMMFAGFPNFRLPVQVLHAENNLEAWGAVSHYGVSVDRPLLERLLADYDAVLAGTGKFREERLGVPGQDLDGVLDALHFLIDVKLGRAPRIGPRVVVVGAGYTAQDASRTARRLGCEVQVLYRRAAEDMPVHGDRRNMYIARQAAEGAPYVFEVAPVRVLGQDGRVAGLECAHTRPGPLDASGRPTAEIGDDRFIIDCETVIAAVGESADLSFLPPDVERKAGRIAVDGHFRTTRRGLFAAGEVAGSQGTEHAFAAGLAAAEGIHTFLKGELP
jgi:NADPH-dependent glutamate synthase beta subunit-like oxidoreductase